jgi:uncharacterized membrane protein
MLMLIAGLLIFLGVHSISIVSRSRREQWVQRLGEGPWKGLYSLIALVGLVLIILGYAQARDTPLLLYSLPMGFRHLAALLMLPVFVLLAAAYLPGRIQRMAQHPMLLAVKLWAVAHLLAQSATGGTLADILLFGGFLVWAVADRISVKRRGTKGPQAQGSTLNDVIAVAVGLGAYVLFVLWAHAWLFGVSPFG